MVWRTASNEEKEIVRNAIAKGIVIVGSAGNFYSEKVETPSALPGVISVAAVDSVFRKVKAPNFEMRVDMSAPGEKVYGAYPVADNAYSYFDGTATLPDNLLAKFSGNNIPPVITTLSHEVLIWFVTDATTTGKGWKLKYETVE